jgi:DNA-binding response OmpR family regulator
MRLLYVTDRQVDDYLVGSLREARHVVELTNRPADGVEMAASGAYDGVVLDWSTLSPDCSARFRAAAPAALIAMIAESADGAARAGVLDAGADACFVRPVPFIELETRLQALARLGRTTRSEAAAAVELLAAQCAVRVGGKTIPLAPQEYQLAAHLVAHIGEVVTLERLRQQVWGDDAETGPELVRTSISRLRRKLATAQADGLLRAVKGHGYVLDPY